MPIGGKDAFLSKITFRRESKWYSKTKQELKELNNMATIEERAKKYSLKDFDGYYTGREKALEEGYIAGANEQKAIDEEVRLKEWKLTECNVMTQEECDREAAFAEWYLENRKGTPTYSDAIEWARRDMLDEVCAILSDLGVFDWMASDDLEGFSPEVHKDQFVKCFIEE